MHLEGTAELLFESEWTLPPLFSIPHLFSHGTCLFTIETTKNKTASQRDKVTERIWDTIIARLHQATHSCNVQASLCSLKELKYPVIYL